MFQVNDNVLINKGDEYGTVLEGKITRVWENGKYISVLVNGRSTYVRSIVGLTYFAIRVYYVDSFASGRYEVFRPFDSREAAQEFLDNNAMVHPLPHGRIVIAYGTEA